MTTQVFQIQVCGKTFALSVKTREIDESTDNAISRIEIHSSIANIFNRFTGETLYNIVSGVGKLPSENGERDSLGRSINDVYVTMFSENTPKQASESVETLAIFFCKNPEKLAVIRAMIDNKESDPAIIDVIRKDSRCRIKTAQTFIDSLRAK